MRSVYFDKKKFYIRSAFPFAFSHYHCFRCIRGKTQIFLQSIGQSNSFTSYISFDDLTFNTCGYFSRPMGVWKKYILMLNHRVRDYYSFIYEQFVRLVFDIHPTALSERSIRIFPLFSSIRPSHIFRLRCPNEV